MPTEVARWFVLGLEVYSGLGLAFATGFALWGAARLDPTARTGTPGFRLLLLPGAAALWPWLLLRLHRAARPAREPEEAR